MFFSFGLQISNLEQEVALALINFNFHILEERELRLRAMQ